VGQALVLGDEADQRSVEDRPLVLAERIERTRLIGVGKVSVDAGDEIMGAGEILGPRSAGDRQNGEDGGNDPQLTDPQNRWMRAQASSSSTLDVA
jgi:hypothetical protein